MTLVQIRQTLVEQSGYRGLVTSAPTADYTDKAGLLTNGTYYINAGVKWLNRRWASKGTFRKVSTTITAGNYLLSVASIQNIKRIDVISSSMENRVALTYRDIHDLRDGYTAPYADLDNGTPASWSYNTVAATTAAGTDNLILLPPADTTYTVEIFTDLTTPDLSAESDTNWWTIYHPELVVRAARIQLEMDGHRNISGVKAFQVQVEEEVYRMASEATYAYIAGYTPEGFTPNG